MRTAEGKDRIDREEEMRQGKRAHVEMDAADGHDKQAEANSEDEQMEEARDTGQGTAEKGDVQYGESSSSTSQARPSSCAGGADAKPDDVQMDPQDGEVSTENRERSGSMQTVARTSGTSRKEAQR